MAFVCVVASVEPRVYAGPDREKVLLQCQPLDAIYKIDIANQRNREDPSPRPMSNLRAPRHRSPRASQRENDNSKDSLGEADERPAVQQQVNLGVTLRTRPAVPPGAANGLPVEPPAVLANRLRLPARIDLLAGLELLLFDAAGDAIPRADLGVDLAWVGVCRSIGPV